MAERLPASKGPSAVGEPLRGPPRPSTQGLCPPALPVPQGCKSWWVEKQPRKQQLFVFNEEAQKEPLVLLGHQQVAVLCSKKGTASGQPQWLCPPLPCRRGKPPFATPRWSWGSWGWPGPASARFPAPPAAGPEHLPALGPVPEAGVVGVSFQQGHTAALDSQLLCCHLGLWAWAGIQGRTLVCALEWERTTLFSRTSDILFNWCPPGIISLHDFVAGCFHDITVNILKYHKLLTVSKLQ